MNLTKELQVNSILASDRTLTRKKSKKDDFLEHQSILQHALAANPCDGSNANGKPPNPITTVYMTHVFSELLETLTNCKENIEGCGTPLTASQVILDEITECKTLAENFIAGSPSFLGFLSLILF